LVSGSRVRRWAYGAVGVWVVRWAGGPVLGRGGTGKAQGGEVFVGGAAVDAVPSGVGLQGHGGAGLNPPEGGLAAHRLCASGVARLQDP